MLFALSLLDCMDTSVRRANAWHHNVNKDRGKHDVVVQKNQDDDTFLMSGPSE